MNVNEETLADVVKQQIDDNKETVAKVVKEQMDVNEETLANLVHSYNVLYDKNHKDFHRKDIKSNAWDEIAGKLSIKNGNSAEKEFIKLREKYSRYKREFMKKQNPGESLNKFRKAQKRVEELSFLSWLDDYIQPRKSKTNIRNTKTEIQEYDTYNHQSDDGMIEGSLMTDEEDLDNSHLTDATSYNSKVVYRETTNDTLKESFSLKLKDTKECSTKKDTEIHDENEEKEDKIRGVSEAFRTVSKRDSHDIFGEYIASKMRKLSSIVDNDTMENMEFEITSVIAENYKKFKSHSLPASSYYYTSTTPTYFSPSFTTRKS